MRDDVDEAAKLALEEIRAIIGDMNARFDRIAANLRVIKSDLSELSKATRDRDEFAAACSTDRGFAVLAARACRIAALEYDWAKAPGQSSSGQAGED